MKFTTRIAAIAGSLTALLLTAGCASWGASAEAENARTRIAEIEPEAHEEVNALGRSAGDRLLKAFQTNDFALTAGIPVGDEKNTLTQRRFDEVVAKVIRANGGIQACEYLTELNTPPYKMLLWKVTFAPQKNTAKDAASDADDSAATAAGLDMLFELWMGKLDGQYRVVGFRFKL